MPCLWSSPLIKQFQAEQVAQSFVQSGLKSLPKKPVLICHTSKGSCPTTSVIPVRSWLCSSAWTLNSSHLLPMLRAFVCNLVLLSGERQSIPKAGHASFYNECRFALSLILARPLGHQGERCQACGGRVQRK